MHQPEYTQFVDEIPLTSLQVCYQAFQGTIPDKATVGLACLNVASYAGGLALGEPGGTGPVVVMASAPVDTTDTKAVDDAFRAATALPKNMGKAGVAAGAINWRLILEVVLKILAGLLV